MDGFLGATISNCKNRSSVSGKNTHVGGLAGTVLSCGINDCENSGLISGADVVGGMLGYGGYYYITGTSLVRCKSNGTISCIGSDYGLIYGVGTDVVQR